MHIYKSETLIFLFSLIIGLISPIFIINFDSIYSLQEIIRFNKSQPYSDWFPFVGFFQPLILSGLWIEFLNIPINIIFYSGLFNLFYAFAFYKLTFQTTKNRVLSKCAVIVGSLWFSTNFGISFYQDYLSYFFFLISLIFFNSNLKEFQKNIFISIFLICSFYTKNSIGIICNVIYFFVFIVVQIQNKKLYLNFFIIYLLTFFISFLIIITIYDKNNFFIYHFKILYIELSWRLNVIEKENSNLMNLFKFFIYPFKIDLLNLIYNPGFGRLLFLPFVFFVYFCYYEFFIIIKKFFKNFYLSNKDLTFIFIFLTSISIQYFAGRNFTHSIFGIFLLIFFINSKYKNIFAICMSIFLFILNIPFKFNESVFNKHDRFDYITTNKLYPIHFSSVDKKIKSTDYLPSLNYLESQKILNTYAVDYNSKILNFLNGSGGLEYNSYYFLNPTNKYNNTYDCKIVVDCEFQQINFLKKHIPTYITINDIIYLNKEMPSLSSFINQSYYDIYIDSFFNIKKIVND